MKIYISGPMTGIKDDNYPLFEEVEQKLISMRYEVLSPHKVEKKNSWQEYMRADLKLLLECDCILMLPGWENSRGAILEKNIADNLRMFALYQDDFEILK